MVICFNKARLIVDLGVHYVGVHMYTIYKVHIPYLIQYI